MLTLKVTPNEFAAMIVYLRGITNRYQQMPLQHQRVSILVLAAYLLKWNPLRLAVWQHRRFDKDYSLALPLPVAKALYDEMSAFTLPLFQQLFLDKLHLALVNYRNPYAEAHVIGELIAMSGY